MRSVLRLNPDDAISVVRLRDEMDSVEAGLAEIQEDLARETLALASVIESRAASLEKRVSDVSGDVRGMLIAIPMIILGILGAVWAIVRFVRPQVAPPPPPPPNV